MQALHGDLAQSMREQTLDGFRKGKFNVLIATDVAARGLDITGIELVMMVDPPADWETYIHRSGRTGRAGASGLAVSFILADAPGSEAHFRLIEKRQQQRVPREVVAGFEPAAAPVPPAVADATGGIKGRRPSKKDKLRAATAAAAAPARTRTPR